LLAFFGYRFPVIGFHSFALFLTQTIFQQTMKLKPEELSDKGYVLLAALHHKELMPFVSIYIKKNTLFTWLYRVGNMLAACLVVFLIMRTKGQHIPAGDLLLHLCYGFALLLLLIPLHEWLHLLAYKSMGAAHTSLHINLKKFIFLAVADQFVADKKEFRLVALAPFATITALLVTGICLVPPLWAIALAIALMIHTIVCVGDFAMLSFWQYHQSKEIVTYDDKQGGISYFYESVTGNR
jgi:hypothetical protein